MSETVRTPEFIASYAYVFDKAQQLDGSEAYTITMVFDDEPKDRFKDLVILCQKAIEKKFDRDTALEFGKALNQQFGQEWIHTSKFKLRSPFVSGNLKNTVKNPFYKDKIIITAKNKQYAPGILTLDGTEVSKENGNTHLFYSGCKAMATVNAFAYNNKSQGVSFSLQNLCKTGEGTPLAGKKEDAKDAFADLVGEGYEDGYDEGF